MLNKEQYDRNLQMMKNPNNWPVWPILPLKKPGSWEMGIMVDGYGPTVFLTNMFQVSDLSQVEKLKFIDYEGLLDAGWVVD